MGFSSIFEISAFFSHIYLSSKKTMFSYIFKQAIVGVDFLSAKYCDIEHFGDFRYISHATNLKYSKNRLIKKTAATSNNFSFSYCNFKALSHSFS